MMKHLVIEEFAEAMDHWDHWDPWDHGTIQLEDFPWDAGIGPSPDQKCFW